MSRNHYTQVVITRNNVPVLDCTINRTNSVNVHSDIIPNLIIANTTGNETDRYAIGYRLEWLGLESDTTEMTLWDDEVPDVEFTVKLHVYFD